MTTEERLTKVERELARTKRRFRWLLVGLALGLGALALVWASAASVPKAEAQGAVGGRTVRANKFILEDEDGKTRAFLAAIPGGSFLGLCDAAGMPRAVLSVGDGARLSLYDTAGKERALLKTVKGDPRYNMGEDMPMLALFDDKGWPDIVLGTMRLELPNRQSIMNPKPSLLFFGGGINTSNVIWRAP